MLRIYRNREASAELAETRQRVRYLESENGELYSELATLRQQLSRIGDQDALLRRLQESETNRTDVERLLEGARADLDAQSAALQAALRDADQQRERYLLQREELRRLQESSE